MERTRKKAALTGVTSGVFAGLVAGILMIAVFVAISVSRDGDIWPALKGPAVLFLQERALAPGFDLPAVLLGMFTHFALSSAFGATFGLLVFGLSRPVTLVAGAAFGILVFALMFDLVLPLTGAGAAMRGVSASQAAAFHALYGLALATAYLPFQRVGDAPGIGRPWWTVLRPRGATHVDAH